MSDFTVEIAPQLTEHLQSQLAAATESLNQCFDLALRLQNVTESPWSDVSAAVAGQPGLVCLFQIGSVAAAVLVPESLLLPDWYRQPNDSQTARLDTLAMEWGITLFPEEFEVERTASLVVADLSRQLDACQPDATALTKRLAVLDADNTELGHLTLVWPLMAPAWTNAAPLTAAEPTAPATPSAGFEAEPAAQPAESAAPLESTASPAPRMADPLARLRRLPVTVSVLLSERRISVSQLLGITPGALLTFNKPCDDLLDLYVNNSLYARGEAVKINECFGLKINEIGVQPVRPSKVIND